MELGGKLKKEERKIKRQKEKKIWNERVSKELHGKETRSHFQDGKERFSREDIKWRLKGEEKRV